jgi:long-chain acyl-CoA synthetase
MDISNNVKDSIGKLAKALKDGNNIVIFPEGTRTKDGEIAEFKQTFAIIAKEMKIPVIPVCISGAFEKIKVGKTMPKFGSKIKVQFLKQMLPDATESYENFAERVREEIDKVLQKERCI